MLKSRIVLLLFGLPALAVAQTGLFGAGGSFAVGANPESIVTADFNGDGKLDLATANSGDNTVSVLLGDGTGHFAPASTFFTGSGPLQVLAADLNRDGKRDLVVLNGSGNSLTVLLGTGSGGFSPAVASPFSLQPSPTSMVSADFNLDGIPDLAIAYNSGGVVVYLGDGRGGFVQQSVLPGYHTGAAGLAAADFNGDGKPDILLIPAGSGSGGSFSYVFPGTGDGAFGSAVIGTLPLLVQHFNSNVAVGDFNGDGKPDVAEVETQSGALSLLLGGSQQTLSAYFTNFVLGAFCFSIAAADFNGDGQLDIALANFQSGTVSVLLGDGASTPHFTLAAGSPFAVGPRPLIAAGEFNGDGKPDLATSSGTANSITILVNGGPGRPGGVGSTPQTITFPTPTGPHTFGDPPFTLSATSTSGLPVTFTSGTPSVCTVAGSTLTIVSAGLCTVAAGQAGNAVFSPALPTAVTFNVDRRTQTITFAPLPDRPLGSPPFPISATASSGLPVTFLSETPSVCVYRSNSSPSNSLVYLNSLGTCSIEAIEYGDGNYLSAAVIVSFAVTAAGPPQTITFPPISDQPFTWAGIPLMATASSGLPVSYDASAPTCTVHGSNLLLFALGTCTIIASQNGNGTVPPATPVTRSFTILPGLQTITFQPPEIQLLSSGKVLLLASSSAALAVAFSSSTPAVCTISGVYAILVSAGTCTVTATVPPNPLYNPAAPVTVSFAVFAPSPPTPMISEVDNGFSNIPNSPIQSGSWVVIRGANLSNTNPGRGWNAGENFPTSMDGTSVTVNGKAAFLYYISPTQLNIQAPTDSMLGRVSVVVTNNGAISTPATAQYQASAPALLQWGGGQYPYALITRGGDLIGNPAVTPGAVSAHSGDTVTLWATGLGPTNPAVPAGQQPSGFPQLSTLPNVTIGGTDVTVFGAVLSYSGLYQVNIQVPALSGDVPIRISQTGFHSPEGVLIHVE